MLVGMLIPRPITVTGPFVVAPALSVALTAPDSGLVGRVYVREGTRVEAGMPLLQVRDLDLERAALATARQADSLAARIGQARAAGRTAEVARLEADRATEAARLAGMTATQRDLTIRALVPGIVVTHRPERLAGQWVQLGDRLIELGQPDSLDLRIALVGAGATRVQTGQPVRLVFHADARDRRRARDRRGPVEHGGGGGRRGPRRHARQRTVAARHDRRSQRHAPAVEPLGGALVGGAEAGADGSVVVDGRTGGRAGRADGRTGGRADGRTGGTRDAARVTSRQAVIPSAARDLLTRGSITAE